MPDSSGWMSRLAEGCLKLGCSSVFWVPVFICILIYATLQGRREAKSVADLEQRILSRMQMSNPTSGYSQSRSGAYIIWYQGTGFEGFAGISGESGVVPSEVERDAKTKLVAPSEAFSSVVVVELKDAGVRSYQVSSRYERRVRIPGPDTERTQHYLPGTGPRITVKRHSCLAKVMQRESGIVTAERHFREPSWPEGVLTEKRSVVIGCDPKEVQRWADSLPVSR